MLILDQSLYQAMLEHVQACYPLEACGVLGGLEGRALRVYPIDNKLQSPVAFEMEPLQQVRAMLDIEAQGMELAAVYHSHPYTSAQPSATDIAHALYPEAIQLIISLQNREQPTLRAFTIIDGVVDEVTWRIE